MSEKYLTDKLICPYCDKPVSIENTRLPKLQAWIRNKWSGTYDLIEAARTKKFNDWSCLACEKKGHTEYPDHSKQNYGIGGPILMYADKKMECSACKQTYIFYAFEQRFWYEELRFNYSSIPVHCLECRKKIRKPKVLNKKLSELLKTDPMDADILEKIGDIYKELGIEDKATLFYARAKNKRK